MGQQGWLRTSQSLEPLIKSANIYADDKCLKDHRVDTPPARCMVPRWHCEDGDQSVTRNCTDTNRHASSKHNDPSFGSNKHRRSPKGGLSGHFPSKQQACRSMYVRIVAHQMAGNKAHTIPIILRPVKYNYQESTSQISPSQYFRIFRRLMPALKSGPPTHDLPLSSTSSPW